MKSILSQIDTTKVPAFAEKVFSKNQIRSILNELKSDPRAELPEDDVKALLRPIWEPNKIQK